MSEQRAPAMFNACAVIPVFNHERAIGSVVEALRAQELPVLLVDDGSNETCARELERLSTLPQVFLLRHARNCGKGAAVSTGLREAARRGYTHALQIDADGQHVTADARRLIEEARAFPDHMICGAPTFDASMPKARHYGRYLTHALVWLETLSFDIVDSMCGFRVYPLATALALIERKRLGRRMDFDVEVLVRLHWRGVRLRWVPTRVSYPLDGVSHFRMVFDNVLMTGLHLRLVPGMLVRLPVLLWRRRARGSARVSVHGGVNGTT